MQVDTDLGRGLPLSTLNETVKLDIAYGGSRTAGKREGFDAHRAVLHWAAARGLKVAAGVKLYLQVGTADVRDYCVQRGYLMAFEAVGAELLQPGCGACANCGPRSSERSEQVTVSAINRNFPGRSGPRAGVAGQPGDGGGDCDRGRADGFRRVAAP